MLTKTLTKKGQDDPVELKLLFRGIHNEQCGDVIARRALFENDRQTFAGDGRIPLAHVHTLLHKKTEVKRPELNKR